LNEITQVLLSASDIEELILEHVKSKGYEPKNIRFEISREDLLGGLKMEPVFIGAQLIVAKGLTR
jgi:hypothetical protein